MKIFIVLIVALMIAVPAGLWAEEVAPAAAEKPVVSEKTDNAAEEAKPEHSVEEKMHMYLAAELNNQAWTILDKTERTPEEEAMMLYFALGAKHHWGLHPHNTPLNAQRAAYLLSRVYCALNKPAEALEQAQECLSLTEENKYAGFDRAFCHEAMARALAANGEAEHCQMHLALAVEAGKTLTDPEEKKLFDGEMAREPWFGMKK